MRIVGRVGCWNCPLFAITSLLALFALSTLGASISAAKAVKTKLVVVLYPDDNDGRPGNLAVDQSIRSTFASGAAEPIEVHSEYLDISRFHDAEYQQRLAEFLRRKYAGRNVDLVLTGLASALDYALKYREHAFPGVPIVFCAVDQREVQARNLPTDVIGAPIKMDLTGTLDVALRIHPSTRRIFVVTGKSKFDVEWEAEAREAFRAYEDKLEFKHFAGVPVDELLTQVARLPEQSIIYYVHVFWDGTGRNLIPAEVLGRIADKANVPIYGHVDTYLGRGIVGGRVFSFEAAGKDAATLALRILAGEKPESIGVQRVRDNQYIFDWRRLRQWGISETNLPPGSEVRYRELGFWDQYKWHIMGVISLCVIQAFLIVGLLFQRAGRRKAEKRFQHAVEAAPTGMLMVDQNGTVTLANAQVEKLFGYLKSELLGRPVEMLLPDRFRGQHPTHRDGYFANPEARPMGVGRDLFGRCKDGTEVLVEIGLSPVQNSDGLFVLASIVDITQRRLAEKGLLESQRELRTLTGRLLMAQETERRHIARELHDDLNQSLALLSVELEMLGRKPPDSTAELRGRVDALAARVKQLSTSVHDLSHHLHPSKLEQLGVLAAVRGLCKELAQSYGTQIEFSHQELPASVPDNIGLGLYRIVQEALGNVIKHSGAHRADVELCCNSSTIRLRIVDDGTGFDPKSVDGKGGLGLVSMRERLRLVNGEIVIDSHPAGGTRVEVVVPLGAGVEADGQLKQ